MRKLLCKENLIYVGIVISVILVYLIRIVKSPISIDTEAYIASPSTIINSWDSISRISLGILKKLFNNININLALTNIVSFIILLISQFFLCNHILKKLNKKSLKNYVIFIATSMTSIFTIETYAFTLQIFEISICYLMMILSFILIDKIIYENKWYLSVLVIPIIGFTFNAYQSFYILFITLSCIFFIININSDNSVKSILKYILIFILAFIFSFLFLKIFTNVNGINNDNGYILEQINYKNDLKKGILYLGATLIYSTFGRYVINVSFFLAGLLLLLSFKKNKDKMYIIASSILLISPFLLSLVFGNYTFFRSQLSIPLIISFVFVSLNNNSKINKFIIFNMIYQILCVGLLFYYDNIRFDNDKKILNNTINYYSSNCKDESIVFIGNTKYKVLNGEMLGNSFYNWDYDSDSLSNNRIKDFSKSLNIDYKYPTKNEIAYVISNIEKYNEAYQIDNNILIVNVSKVEY